MDNYQELPYYQDLVKIRSFMEESFDGGRVHKDSFFKTWEPFSKGWCGATSAFVTQRTGLYIVFGKYVTGNSSQPHALNYDSERKLCIDLTIDQFGDFPPIFIGNSPTNFRKETCFASLDRLFTPRDMAQRLEHIFAR